MGVMDPLRREHGELLPHIEQLRAAGELVGHASLPDLVRAVDEALAFLRDQLIPHAAAEDAALYPVVERVMQAPGATATMRRDHEEVMRLVGQLGSVRDEFAYGDPTPDDVRDLQRLLYGLFAVVELHFAKEEEIYLPQLEESLTPGDAADLFHAMEQATATAEAAEVERSHTLAGRG